MQGPVGARRVRRKSSDVTNCLDAKPDGHRTVWTTQGSAKLESPRTAALYERARRGASGAGYGDAIIDSRSPRSFDSVTTSEGRGRQIEQGPKT